MAETFWIPHTVTMEECMFDGCDSTCTTVACVEHYPHPKTVASNVHVAVMQLKFLYRVTETLVRDHSALTTEIYKAAKLFFEYLHVNRAFVCYHHRDIGFMRDLRDEWVHDLDWCSLHTRSRVGEVKTRGIHVQCERLIEALLKDTVWLDLWCDVIAPARRRGLTA